MHLDIVYNLITVACICAYFYSLFVVEFIYFIYHIRGNYKDVIDMELPAVVVAATVVVVVGVVVVVVAAS